VKIKKSNARAILLDWDGTLLNSYVADSRAYLAMFRALGIDWTMRDVDRHYSPNWHLVYKAACIERADWERADRLWAQAYRSERPRLLGGARGVLRRLERHFVLGLVTSGNRKRVRRQLREFELAGHFSTCVCCEDAPKRKPHPAPLELAMERMRIEPRDCLYVGGGACRRRARPVSHGEAHARSAAGSDFAFDSRATGVCTAMVERVKEPRRAGLGTISACAERERPALVASALRLEMRA
jgi:HAD superfamily hydrolase (TIGR01509 family)